MEFKGLNDGYRRRALPYFLRAADQIPGFCVAIGIDKRIEGMLITKDMVGELHRRGSLKGKWNFRSLESMFRIVHFVAMFLAVLSHPGQNVYWISDEDDLFANPNKTVDTKRMVEALTSAYIHAPLGELGLGTTKIDEADRFDEDSAAVADLVAGASAELLSSILTSVNEIPKERPQFLPGQISRKSDVINDWFYSEHGSLRKCGVVLSLVAPRYYRVGTWTLDDALVQLS